MRAWLSAALTLGAQGCALQEGHGFATLERASLEASFEPEPARTLDGQILTSEGFLITVDSLILRLDQLVLSTLTASGSEGFDPASPPPGYSLCHGGHCHKDDGSLVSYADIAADLAGGEQGFLPIVSFPIAAPVDLLGSSPLLLAAEPSRELPSATIDRATLGVTGADLELTVAGNSPGSETRLHAHLDHAFTGAVVLDVVVDRDSKPHLELSAQVSYGARLFDDIHFSGAKAGELEPSTAVALTENLSQMSLTVSLR